MSKRTTELKTCPFCGAIPKEEEWLNGDKKYHYIECINPKCRIHPSTDYHTNKSVVVREWNRREV